LLNLFKKFRHTTTLHGGLIAVGKILQSAAITPYRQSILWRDLLNNDALMDKEILAQEIRQSADDFIATLSRFNDEQLNTIPFTGSWTAGQLADHVRKATDGIPDSHTRAADRDAGLYVNTFTSLFLDFTIKFESPGFIIPDDGPFQTKNLVEELVRIKHQNDAIAVTSDLTRLCVDFELPGLGHLTRYEWLKFIVVHTRRHTHQLKNIAEKILAINV
jgi:hypothetical protein